MELEDVVENINPWGNKIDITADYNSEFLNTLSEWHEATENVRRNTIWVRQIRGEIERLERTLDIMKAQYLSDANGKNSEQRSAWVLVRMNEDDRFLELESDTFELRAQLADMLADTEVQRSIEKRQRLWAERLNIASTQSRD
jgi:hypothetical protein